MSYYPIRLQAAVFLSAIDFSSKFRIAAIVREQAGARLQADPLLLPLPPDSPPEFPHIVIRDESNGWGFQMTPIEVNEAAIQSFLAVARRLPIPRRFSIMSPRA